MNQDSVHHYLEEIIETMSEGLFIVGPDGRISMVNESMERLTGFSRKELVVLSRDSSLIFHGLSIRLLQQISTLPILRCRARCQLIPM